MVSFGQLTRTGQVLLIGLCDGDPALAESTRAALMGDRPVREAAAEAGMATTTFHRHVENIRGRLQRVLEHGAVKAKELVESDEA